MPGDLHERARSLIDRSIVEGITPQEQTWLDGHVAACVQCSRYADNANRTVRALDSFAFEYDPAVALRIEETVRRYAQRPATARQATTALLVAIALTAAGSVLMWQVAAAAAPRWGVSPQLWQTCFVLLWLLPSVAVDLLLIARPRLLIGIRGRTV